MIMFNIFVISHDWLIGRLLTENFATINARNC